MYLLYSALLALGLLLGSPYWLFEMFRHGKYRRGLGERFGAVPPRLRSDKPSIWVHAVSVGEVLAVSDLIGRLQTEFPKYRIVVSTTTDTGQALAAKRFGNENVFYFPLDFSFSVKRYLAALCPELIVIAETEFWPNLLRLAAIRNIPVAVVNARISDRSFPGYRRWRWLLGRVLENVNLFLAQSPEDARRLAEIGAAPQRVFVSGNLKFDVHPPAVPPIVAQLRSAVELSAARPILVCGSTVEGEEAILIEMFRPLLSTYPRALMLLAPRHPERFQTVAELLQTSGIQFWKRSLWNDEQLAAGILLVDSIGELASLYSLADIAFVGGSLVPRGGHSILEPAQHGVAILVGPHTENFRDIIELFRSRDAVRVVAPENLAAVVKALCANETERRALGQRGFETLQSRRGATQFTLEKLRPLLRNALHEAHTA